MASYPEFVRLSAKRSLRRLYWVCGDQSALREEVVKEITRQAAVADLDFVSMDASSVKESAVWAALNQYPLDPSKRRLVVVRGAEQLRNLAMLSDWLDAKTMRSPKTPGTTAVMVSATPEWPLDHNPELRAKVVKGWTSMYVRCSLPKEDRKKRAGEIICGWGRISQPTAEMLAERVGFDMGVAKGVMAKTVYFKGEVTPKMVEFLSPRAPEDSYAEALLGLDKPRAAESIAELERNEVSRAIGRLASELEMLGRMHGILTRGLSIREMATRLNVSETRIRRLLPIAKLYPRKAVVHRSLLLHKADAAWQRGAREGVMEMLVAAW